MKTLALTVAILIVSTALFADAGNPDVAISLASPLKTDLSLPFPLTINVFTASAVVAHDVDTTVTFRPDVTVKTLPSGCTSAAAGTIVCHADSVAGLLKFEVVLFAPASYGDGKISFSAIAKEREPDSYPPSNSFQASTSLYLTFYVTTTADSGAGSLRQAILDANAATGELMAIAFRIGEPSSTPWKTIRLLSSLPAITAASGLRIDGGTQAGFFGDANPDGPEIEISGGGTIDGDGLLVATCNTEVANLSIGGFLRNGISVAKAANPVCAGHYPTAELHHLFLGSDPTGSSARSNARGIGTSVPSGNAFNSALNTILIHDCVISGNTFSGIFGLSGRLAITNNRIGAKAHADEPLSNGASGVFIGTGGEASTLGPDIYRALDDNGNPHFGENVIAFNRETGVAIAAGVKEVSVRNNRIWSNGMLGIDIGLNGPTASAPADLGGAFNMVTAPVLTIARFDPAQNKTIIEGDIPDAALGHVPVPFDGPTFAANVYASDAADPSGYGEGQRSLGASLADATGHFHFETAGDLTGQWITATNTRSRPADLQAEGYFRQTSEFGRGVPVQ